MRKSKVRKRCIICQKICKEKYCSEKCGKIGRRVYSSFYGNPYYQKNKEQLKINTKVYKKEKKFYDRPIKNKIREFLVEKCREYNVKEILALESPDFLFSKLLPEKKIYVFEQDNKTFQEMIKSKPLNVVLFEGEISMFSELSIFPEFIYLDFCGTFNSSQETIFLLKDKIKNCKLFGITFCLREPHKKKEFGDYEINLISKLQSILGFNMQILFGQSYRDKEERKLTAPMITLLFKTEGTE